MIKEFPKIRGFFHLYLVPRFLKGVVCEMTSYDETSIKKVSG